MTVEIEEVKHVPKQEKSGLTGRPTIIKWQDVSMIRSHSVQATIRELLQALDSQDVVQVNIIGDPSSGKTVLGKVILHLIHKLSKIPFSIRVFEKEDLLDFQATLKTLDPTNYALLFDDLSFLGAVANRKQIEMVKQAITEIRHLPGGQDVKILIIKVFHYTLGLDKYLRQNDFTYFTSVGSSEDENMEKIVGHKNMNKVHNFKKMRTKIKIAPEAQKKFTYHLGSKGSFTYHYRVPFQPELFWNNDTLRNIVSPTREWIDKTCTICSTYATKKKMETQVDVKTFIDESKKSYGTGFKLAVQNILKENGVNTHRPNVVAAERMLKEALMTKQINLEDLTNTLELTKTRTTNPGYKHNPLKAIIQKAKLESHMPEESKIHITNGLDADIKMEEAFDDGT